MKPEEEIANGNSHAVLKGANDVTCKVSLLGTFPDA